MRSIVIVTLFVCGIGCTSPAEAPPVLTGTGDDDAANIVPDASVSGQADSGQPPTKVYDASPQPDGHQEIQPIADGSPQQEADVISVDAGDASNPDDAGLPLYAQCTTTMADPMPCAPPAYCYITTGQSTFCIEECPDSGGCPSPGTAHPLPGGSCQCY